MVFPICSATEVTLGHLEITVIKTMKPQQDKLKGKVILELFFNSSGNIHMEFIPEVATVNKHHYKELLRCLCSLVES
jgi:hypothetical protein